MWGMDRQTLYNLLDARMSVLALNQRYCKGVEERVSAGIPQRQAQGAAITKIVGTIFRGTVDEDEEISATEKLIEIAQMVREGQRWQDLIDTFGAKDVLFIGTQELSDETPVECGDIVDRDMGLVEALQKFPIDVSLRKLMRRGSDLLFGELKEFLLRPDVRFKETCHRLNGLYDMVGRLRDLEKSGDTDNNAQQLEGFLISEITKRIKEVLGKPEARRDLEHEESEVDGSDLESGDEADDDSVAHSGDEP
jgi:hypothetical protein